MGKICSLFQVNKYFALYTFPLLILGDFSRERFHSYHSLEILERLLFYLCKLFRDKKVPSLGFYCYYLDSSCGSSILMDNNQTEA